MTAVREKFLSVHPELELSVGDTPTCSQASDLGLADEIRPGNFVYYDLMQVQIGSCTADQIAVAMACPVVAKHEDRREVVVHGGAVHFSKDRIEESGRPIYGRPVEDRGDLWGAIIEGGWVRKLSQDHGIVRLPKEKLERTHVGDLLKILPVHSCLTADLMERQVFV